MKYSISHKYITPESAVQSACMQYLKVYGIMVWRNNSFVMPDKNGRPLRAGLPGSADIFGITNDGRFLSIECKKSIGGKVSVLQKQFADQINGRGGVAIIVHGLDDMIDQLKERRVIK